jgi:phosphoserine aminotransferase
MTRVFNFSAGPAALPEEVLAHAQAEMLDYQGRGLSVMEMSHRSEEFVDIASRAEADFRALLDVGDDYHVLFLQGGATLQFSMVPFNLARAESTADYVITGSWGNKAIKEAESLLNVHVAATSEAEHFNQVPPVASWKLTRGAAYLHVTGNETIGGVEIHEYPDAGDVPLVADLSSTLLSRPLDVDKFGLIYAGAQKNIGPAGITVVVVRKDLVGRARPGTPSMLDYAAHAAANSMFNTPPTYAWYLSGLVFSWLKDQGGLAAMAKVNRRKAEKLYGAVDNSNFYRCPVAKPDRSWMNVPFTLADASLDASFLEQAAASGLINLKGHRSVGGMRASIYNAVPEEGVDALIDFMLNFEADHARD